MTHQELLEAYIKPAIDNNCLIEGQKITGYRWGANSTGALTISTEDNEYSLMPIEILFNHVFASAFFGMEPFKHYVKIPSRVKSGHILTMAAQSPFPDETPTKFEWQYHLQQMVIHDGNPLLYLEKFVEDGK